MTTFDLMVRLLIDLDAHHVDISDNSANRPNGSQILRMLYDMDDIPSADGGIVYFDAIGQRLGISIQFVFIVPTKDQPTTLQDIAVPW